MTEFKLQTVTNLGQDIGQEQCADLAISIQVGVESGPALPIGSHVHEGWHVGVVLGEEDIKHVAASMVWSALRTCQAHHTCDLQDLCYNTMHNTDRYNCQQSDAYLSDEHKAVEADACPEHP